MENKNNYKQVRNASNLKIDFNQVIYLQANVNYTKLHYVNNKTEIFAYTLGLFEAQLGISFIRIHKAFLVNRQFIALKKQRKVMLLSGEFLPIARRRKFILGNKK
jgi:DNA-binding LytR/AlgR family response regulator